MMQCIIDASHNTLPDSQSQAPGGEAERLGMGGGPPRLFLG